MPGRQQVIDKLGELGKLYPGGSFNQDELQQRLPAKATIVVDGGTVNVDISTRTGLGYCTGACTDWARKVLQGGRPVYSPDKLKHGADNPNSVSLRHAAIQARGDVARERAAEALDLERTIHPIFEAARLKYTDEKDPAVRQQIRSIKFTTNIETRIGVQLPAFQKSPDHSYDLLKVKELLLALHDRVDTLEHTTTPGWAAFVFDMDCLHMAYRMGHVNGNSKRPFKHIKILKCEDKKDYGSIPAALGVLFKMAEFVEGTVMIIGFDTSGPGTGHAVAVYAWTNGRYMLFDPNFGVFVYYRRGAVEALLYLFAGLGGDGPAYIATGGVGYLLLAKAT